MYLPLCVDGGQPGIRFRDISTLVANHGALQASVDSIVERFRGENIELVAGTSNQRRRCCYDYDGDILMWQLFVTGLEARGFIWGPAVALALGAGFVMLRKPNKLPGTQRVDAMTASARRIVIRERVCVRVAGETVMVDYGKEYGKDRICMHVHQCYEGKRTLIVDDLLATGGTAKAAWELLSTWQLRAWQWQCRRGAHYLHTTEKANAAPVAYAFVVELDGLGGREALIARAEGAPVAVYSVLNEK